MRFETVTEDGGSPIFSYSLEMSSDSGVSYYSVSGEDADDLTIVRVVTDGIVAG